jgi:hypothetical protein
MYALLGFRFAEKLAFARIGRRMPYRVSNRKENREMGMFKQMKDMKNVVEAAPGMIDQAQQMGAQAQEMAAAQQAAAMQAQQQAMAANTAAAASGEGDFSPINGVTIEQYAAVCKSLGPAAADQAKAHESAAAAGIEAADWDAAAAGWAARMQGGTAVGQRFNQLYMGG